MDDIYRDESILQTCEEEGIGGQSLGKYTWVDITNEFKSSCTELGLGELLHDSKFGLIEGMSAIEMMDPKMDAGMTSKKEKIKSLLQAFKEGHLKSKDFSSEELIGIIDDSYSCLMSWLEGHSLAQTVFINLYLHDPCLIHDKTLRSFSICMLKMAGNIRDKILKAAVYEEEDFQAVSYNFNLDVEAEDGSCMSVLKEVEEKINKNIKTAKAKSMHEGHGEASVPGLKASVALLSRIRFTRSLYALLCNLPVEKTPEGNTCIDRHTKTISDTLPIIIDSINLASSNTESSENGRVFSKGFFPSINQRLLPPTFPRCVSIMAKNSAYQAIKTLLNRVRSLLKVVHLKHFQEIFDFCLEFSNQNPCLLSRSILQMVILPHNKRVFGRESMLEVVKESIKAFSAPAVLLNKSILSNNQQAKECTEAFIYRTIHPLLHSLQTTGHNRARQRDRWGKILEEFGALQEEAEKLDSYLHSLMLKFDSSWKLSVNFATWILYWSLKTMLLYLLSGLELELYAVHEYTYIFWYMSEGLYSWMATTINKAESFVHDAELWNASNAARSSKKNKKSKKKTRMPSGDVSLYQALHHLTGGFYKAIIGLGLEDKLHVPKFDFDCEEVRYNRRFAPFIFVPRPPLLSYNNFKEHTDTSSFHPPIRAEDLFIAATHSFNQAKTHLESIPKPTQEVADILKVARTNMVVIRILQNANTKYSKISPEFSFDTNKNFPTIKLPSKQH